MKKTIALLLVLVLALSLVACGSEPVSVDIAQVKADIIGNLEIEGAMDLPTERLLDLYGISSEWVKTSACFITMGGTFPDEIVMLEAADTASAREITQKLETRLADVKNQAQNYDAESYALLEKCKVTTSGVYVTLFISAKSEQMQKIFDDAK